jgi:hypothetical protein
MSNRSRLETSSADQINPSDADAYDENSDIGVDTSSLSQDTRDYLAKLNDVTQADIDDAYDMVGQAGVATTSEALAPDGDDHDDIEPEEGADDEEADGGDVEYVPVSSNMPSNHDDKEDDEFIDSSEDDELTPAQRIAKSKDMIVLSEYTTTRKRSSPIWLHFKVAEIRVDETETTFKKQCAILSKYDPEAATEFRNAPEHQIWCCSICFGMPSKSLKACFKRIQKSGHATNCGTHLKDVHKLDFTQRAGSVSSTPNDASSRKRSLSSIQQYL